MSTHEANILDPVSTCLDDSVWDNSCDSEPTLRPVHLKWIHKTIIGTLKKAGYTHMEQWLSLVLTGSLTTYQYSPESDCDVSLFVDSAHFPDWSRAEMIGVMVDNVDGTLLPGTTHPMQCFVVPKEITRESLYQPGLRSGYDLKENKWIVPPEKGRVHDVQAEMNSAYVYALEAADKMEMLLKYEPDKAVTFWHFIHKRRQVDQKAGKGDYSQSNIVYKMLNNRGLFPAISEASGEYIAKTADTIQPYFVDHRAVDKAKEYLGLKYPVQVNMTGGTAGGYHGIQDGAHQVSVVSWLKPESASRQIWHELGHARQYERDPEGWMLEQPNYEAQYARGHEEYLAHPWEQEAHNVANEHPFPLALARQLQGP